MRSETPFGLTQPRSDDTNESVPCRLRLLPLENKEVNGAMPDLSITKMLLNRCDINASEPRNAQTCLPPNVDIVGSEQTGILIRTFDLSRKLFDFSP